MIGKEHPDDLGGDRLRGRREPMEPTEPTQPTEHRVEVSCRSCGAQILFGPLQRTARCPYCDSPSVVDRPATENRPGPVFGLGFAVTRDEAARRMRRWIRGRRMGPFGLKGRSAEKVKGVYVPAMRRKMAEWSRTRKTSLTRGDWKLW